MLVVAGSVSAEYALAQAVVHDKAELAKARKIAFLPLYGASVPLAAQVDLARLWGERWSRVNQGVLWISPYTAGQALGDEILYGRWLGAERQLKRVGALPRLYVQDLCQRLDVDALLQGALGGDIPAAATDLSSAPASTVGLAVRGVTGGRITLTYSLVSCAKASTVWVATRHVDYMRDFSAAELAGYAQRALVDDIPVSTP